MSQPESNPPTPDPNPFPKIKLNSHTLDAIERIAATAAEAGVSYAITAVASIPAWWVAPLTVLLAGIKTILAKFIGDPNTASLI